MNTAAANKIQHFTGMVPAEVREWAHVYWVRFAGQRPTMFSKKIVDRAFAFQVRTLNGDKAVRDTITGNVYILRSNWSMGYDIKRVEKGQAITDYSDYAMVRGEVVARTGFVKRPARLSEIITAVASYAA